jgi:hypothetical protein
MENNNISNDEFIKTLEIKIQELQNCQLKNQLNSCFNCENLIDCKIRIDYVKAVHQSMNKGQTGGFEF